MHLTSARPERYTDPSCVIQELIGTLEEAKSKAVEISQKLAEASATASQIEEVRARYKPAALRGAVLFFVLASLAAISNMYEYSLASFLAVFSRTLDTSKKVRLTALIVWPCVATANTNLTLLCAHCYSSRLWTGCCFMTCVHHNTPCIEL